MIEVSDYKSEVENQWCPGCPNFSILAALKRALVSLGKEPHQICLVSGIGQAAKLPHYLRCNLFNGLHGRAIPAAIGIHVANPELTTIVTTGDGDCYGEGGNHFLHALRRNPDITVIVHNNEIYALTKGQGSPTTPRGEKTRLQFSGMGADPMNMLAIAIISECAFVARGFVGNVNHLTELFTNAITHRGFSLVEVIQPCLIYGTRSVPWYRERVELLSADYNRHDRAAALDAAAAQEDKIPIGVLYEGPARPLFGERYQKQMGKRPLAELPLIQPAVIATQLAKFRG
jgi:2-oxoglutarate ferredoxin oxidoreductase subunit beta